MIEKSVTDERITELEGFEKAMKTRVKEKQEEYGDSWKTVNRGFLRYRVTQNYTEWFETSRNDASRETEMRKLVDLANLCKFLWARLEKMDKETKE